MRGEQLPLQLYLPKHCRLNNFVGQGNAQVVQSLAHQLENPSSGNFLVFGPPGSGKSHLLAAACHWASQHMLTCAYLPLREMRAHGVSVFDEMESMYCVAIDDVQLIVADRAWETALFSLINRAAQSGTLLLFASTAAPAAFGWALPDVQSRMGAALIYRLAELDENDKREALRQLGMDRGMALPDDVIEYLFRHRSRSMHELVQTLSQLDHASLVQKRRITVPFIKTVLRD